MVSLPGITTKYTTRTTTLPKNSLKILPVNIIEDQIDEKVVEKTDIYNIVQKETHFTEDLCGNMFLEPRNQEFTDAETQGCEVSQSYDYYRHFQNFPVLLLSSSSDRV